jgi:hypothetical protein
VIVIVIVIVTRQVLFETAAVAHDIGLVVTNVFAWLTDSRL